jgi:hypothetical protein
MRTGTYVFPVGVDICQRGVVEKSEGRPRRALLPEVGGREEVRGLNLRIGLSGLLFGDASFGTPSTEGAYVKANS